MTLPILVTQEKWQALDEAWQELMVGSGEVQEVVDALHVAGSKKRITRCLPSAFEHAKLLEEEGRSAEAARIMGAALVSGANPAEVAADLSRLAAMAWSEESWYSTYVEISGLAPEATDLRGPWRAFVKLLAFQRGSLIHHAGGWGAGEVLEMQPEYSSMDVRFWNGRKDTFPLAAAIDIFEPLRESDLRAQYFRDPEGLRKGSKKDPLATLRAILVGHYGRSTTAVIRNALMQIGIEGSAWSAWWRKARKQAENSEWFEVTGTPQKSVVSLLLVAKDPAEALRKNLTRAGDLAEVHAKVRDLFVGSNPDPSLVEVALEILAERAALPGEPPEERLAAWLLLRERHGTDPEGMYELLTAVMDAPEPPDPSVPSAFWSLMQALPGVRDQERAIELLPPLFGDDYLDRIMPDLPHAAPGQVRLLVEQATKAGRNEDLKAHYSGLLARPRRAPALLVILAGMFERAQELEGFPTPPQRAQALLNLANHLHEVRRGNPHLTRVCSKLTDLLTQGDDSAEDASKGATRPLLHRLLAGADAGALRSANMTVQRGVDHEIDHQVTEVSLGHDRHFFAAQAGPFWEGNVIWTTKAGMERRSADLRELREVKIPANEEAIGRAAAFGDLSENAEWEAAMEEQRTLTARAMAIEDELRRADLLEEAALPYGTVCPGAVVTYRETESGQEHRIVILGPWDPESWRGIQVVSYKAPLAAGLLGRHPGDQADVELPSGVLSIEVVSTEIPEPV